MIFGINTTPDISKLMYNNFEISHVVFMPNITTNHAIAYTKSETVHYKSFKELKLEEYWFDFILPHNG